MWLETRTARPSAASERSKSRSHRMPCGSRPFAGLVEYQDLRVAEQGAGQAEPLPHAQRVAPGPLLGRVGQAYPLQQLPGPEAGYPGLGGEHSQVVTAGAARVGGPRHPAALRRSGAGLASFA